MWLVPAVPAACSGRRARPPQVDQLGVRGVEGGWKGGGKGGWKGWGKSNDRVG